MQHLVGSGTPVLYIGRMVFKGQTESCNYATLKTSTFGEVRSLHNNTINVTVCTGVFIAEL
jgi:hypothetical protein